MFYIWLSWRFGCIGLGWDKNLVELGWRFGVFGDVIELISAGMKIWLG